MKLRVDLVLDLLQSGIIMLMLFIWSTKLMLLDISKILQRWIRPIRTDKSREAMSINKLNLSPNILALCVSDPDILKGRDSITMDASPKPITPVANNIYN